MESVELGWSSGSLGNDTGIIAILIPVLASHNRAVCSMLRCNNKPRSN
jgi:hypothetical protein